MRRYSEHKNEKLTLFAKSTIRLSSSLISIRSLANWSRNHFSIAQTSPSFANLAYWIFRNASRLSPSSARAASSNERLLSVGETTLLADFPSFPVGFQANKKAPLLPVYFHLRIDYTKICFCIP